MPKFLKGNYRPPKRPGRATPKPKQKDLTQEFEEHALAKLGGSLCFVMKKRGDFIWSDSETKPNHPSSGDNPAR